MTNSTLNYYNHQANEFAQSTLNVDMSAIYSEFLPLLLSHSLENSTVSQHRAKTILDAGCGSGRDALYFKQLGFNVNAFDASEGLAKIAAKNLQQAVPVFSFQQLDSINQYDGIWCCASLLHVPKHELPQVFLNLQNALKPNGILYVSFKYGDGEREHNGRKFTDLNELTLNTLINTYTQLTIIKHWQSVDQRPNREHEMWLNALIKKVSIK